VIPTPNAALAGFRARPRIPERRHRRAVLPTRRRGTASREHAGSDFEQDRSKPAIFRVSTAKRFDRWIMDHLRSGSADATTADVGRHPATGSLTRLLAECRHAKETISAATWQHFGRARVPARTLSDFHSGPLDLIVGNIENVAAQHEIPRTSLLARWRTASVRGQHPVITAAVRRLQVRSSPLRGPCSAPRSARRCLGQRRVPPAASRPHRAPQWRTDRHVAGAPTSVRIGLGRPGGPRPRNRDATSVAGPRRLRRTVPYAGPTVQATAPNRFRPANLLSPKIVRRRGGPALQWYKRTALVLSVVGAGPPLVAALLAMTLGEAQIDDEENLVAADVGHRHRDRAQQTPYGHGLLPPRRYHYGRAFDTATTYSRPRRQPRPPATAPRHTSTTT